MKAFAVMPWTWSPTWVVMTVTPVANIPSVRRNAREGSALPSGLERPLDRGIVRERLADAFRGEHAAVHRDVELDGPVRRFHQIRHVSSRGTASG